VLTVSGCDIEHNDGVGGGINTSFGTTSITGSFVVYNSPNDTFTDASSTLIVINSIIGVEAT
jgi:hypothetical protein